MNLSSSEFVWRVVKIKTHEMRGKRLSLSFLPLKGYVKLTANEIDDRLAVTLSRRNKKIENQKKQEKLQLQQQMAKRMMEAKMKQKLQHQGQWLIVAFYFLDQQVIVHLNFIITWFVITQCWI